MSKWDHVFYCNSFLAILSSPGTQFSNRLKGAYLLKEIKLPNLLAPYVQMICRNQLTCTRR